MERFVDDRFVSGYFFDQSKKVEEELQKGNLETAKILALLLIAQKLEEISVNSR